MNIAPDGRPPGTRPRWIALAIALGAAAVLTACSATPSGTAPSGTTSSGTALAPRTGSASQRPPSGPAWLLTRSALRQLQADPAVRDALRRSRVYEILQPGQLTLAGIAAEPVVTFASAAALEDAISHGRLGQASTVSFTTPRPGRSRR